MCKKCSFPDGVTVKPDGVNILDPCTYKLMEEHRNVTVYVDQCIHCGHVEISWKSTDNTESIIHDKLIEPEGMTND